MLYATEKIKILLVDDDSDDIELFAEAFQAVKVKSDITFLKDGSEAVEYFENTDNETPSILFLDLNMPKIGGLEVLGILRRNSRFRHMPIAIYSTSGSENDIEATLALGANLYIVKPTSFLKLKAIMEKVLKIQWQYETSNLSIDNYLMVVD